MRVCGAVLAGGASRRMGSDKAFVQVEGTPMVARAAAALAALGADPILVVGGDADRLATLDPTWTLVPDRWPGEGPLGGVATALRAAPPGTDVVVVAACDQPWLDTDVLGPLVGALVADPAAAGAWLRTGDGRHHPLPSAWRPSVGGVASEAVEAGLRRLDTLAELGRVLDVAVDGAAALRDVDAPGDLYDP